MKQFIFKFTKWFMIVGLVGALFVWGLLVLFNLRVLPYLFEEFARGEFSKKHGLELSCKRISFGFLRGFVLTDFQISGKVKNRSLFVKAQEIEVDLKVTSLLKRQWEIEAFKVIRGQGYFGKKGKKGLSGSFGSIQGSLLREPARKEGFQGWSGDLRIEDVSLSGKNFLIKKMGVSIRKKRIRIRGMEFLWQDRPFHLEVLAYPFKKSPEIFYKLSGLDFLILGSFKDGKLQWTVAGVHQEKFLAATDFRIGLRESRTWFEGVLGSANLKDGLLRLSVEPDEGLFAREFKVGVYDGFVTGGGWAYWDGAFGGRLSLEGISLASLSQALFPGGQVLEGSIHGFISFLGARHVEDLKAEGLLKVYEGNLWKVNLMKGVLKVFQPVFPSLGEVRFTSCTCRFFIDSGYLYIEELRLASPLVVMKAKGKLGLRRGDLDFTLVLSLKPAGLKDKTFLSKVITAGLMVTGEQVWRIQIGGTWEEPEITPLFFPIFKPIKDLFTAPARLLKKRS